MCLYWVCAGLAVFTLGQLAERSERQPYPGEPSRETLEANLRDVMSSVGGVPTGDVRYFHRGQATGLRAPIVSRTSLHESADRISLEMSKLGWLRVEKTTNNQGLVYLRYCKEGVSATVQSSDVFSDRRVLVGVIWSLSKKHYGYCTRY